MGLTPMLLALLYFGQDGTTQQPGVGHALRQGKTEGQCQSRDAGGGA